MSMKFMVNGWVALLWVDEDVYSMSLLKNVCLLARSVTPVTCVHLTTAVLLLLLQCWRDRSAPERGSSGRAAGGDGLSRDSGSRLGRLWMVPG